MQLSCTEVTGSPAIFRCGHGVAAEFQWTQIVSPVSAVSTAPMGVIGMLSLENKATVSNHSSFSSSFLVLDLSRDCA